MRSILNNIPHAAKEAAAHAERELRARALEAGWDNKVVANLHVRYVDGKFNIYAHDKIADAAFVHEYGNEHLRPTSVIHKFSGNPAGSEKVFLSSLKNHMDGGR